jgi:CHAD domain-containing protein
MAKAKRIKGIKCKSVASAGIKLVLLTRFEELYGFHETALDWGDPEGVHSMRVASRRLRSALRDFTPYLRKRALSGVLKELKDIADALGEVRDQDVAIMALEKIVHHAPEELSPALQQFIGVRREVRDRAREELKATLEQTELKELESAFVASVEEATATRDPAKPQITFQEMSRVVILGRLKELEKLSVGLYQPYEIEILHDMRIAAKRLRYAIELFQQCWRRSIAGYAKRTAGIQTALGDVHDCDVWIESVGKEILSAKKQKQPERVTALMWLLSYLVKVRTKHLRDAFARWCDWEKQDVSGKLRGILSVEHK